MIQVHLLHQLPRHRPQNLRLRPQNLRPSQSFLRLMIFPTHHILPTPRIRFATAWEKISTRLRTASVTPFLVLCLMAWEDVNVPTASMSVMTTYAAIMTSCAATGRAYRTRLIARVDRPVALWRTAQLPTRCAATGRAYRTRWIAPVERPVKISMLVTPETATIATLRTFVASLLGRLCTWRAEKRKR